MPLAPPVMRAIFGVIIVLQSDTVVLEWNTTYQTIRVFILLRVYYRVYRNVLLLLPCSPGHTEHLESNKRDIALPSEVQTVPGHWHSAQLAI